MGGGRQLGGDPLVLFGWREFGKDRQAGRVQVALRKTRDARDVLVLRDGPEGDLHVAIEPVDRRLAAQPGPGLVDEAGYGITFPT